MNFNTSYVLNFIVNIISVLYLTNGQFIYNPSNKTTEIPISSVDSDVLCKFQANGYDCGEKGILHPRFYYDIKMEDCKPTKAGDCEYNLNIFSTVSSCHDTCRNSGPRDIYNMKLPPKVSCRLQPDFGKCSSYHPMWYYDVTERICKGFSYSGCGGNMNRFRNQQACTAFCGGQLDYDLTL